MIFLTGAINTVSLENQNREVEVYQKNGWALKDPTTHDVRIVIEEKDIEEFIKFLRSLPSDPKPKVWKDRNGKEHVNETVSFRMKGTEMSETWVKLRAAIKTDQDLSSPSHQHSGGYRQTAPAARQAPAAHIADQPISSPAAQWKPAPTPTPAAEASIFDEDIPF